MPSLFEYLEQTQRFIRDAKQDFIDPQNIITYINRARREVAMKCQCIRVLTPISGSIIGWTVTNGGTGYSSSPTVTVSSPDFPSGRLPYPNGSQATAQAVVQNGVIVAIESAYGGYGYYQPIITITDSTGKGATATPQMSFINQLNQAQEVYDFSNIDVSQFPGCGPVYYVRSISVIYANYRYSLPVYSFSTYQAMIRQYPYQYQYVSTFAAQFGQGTSGSLYMYPLPSQAYQLELDCLCLPQDLLTDQSVEIIPSPWTDALPSFAAALCYEELQNLNFAKYYHDQFDQRALNYSNYARIGRTINPYGRY